MQMIKKEKILFFVSLLMLLSGAGIVYFKNNTGINNSRQVELTSIKKKDGWGYQIKVNNKSIIQQETIPGIAGYKPFINEEEALKAGRLVLEKLKNGKLPTLNTGDLDAMNIHY